MPGPLATVSLWELNIFHIIELLGWLPILVRQYLICYGLSSEVQEIILEKFKMSLGHEFMLRTNRNFNNTDKWKSWTIVFCSLLWVRMKRLGNLWSTCNISYGPTPTLWTWLKNACCSASAHLIKACTFKEACLHSVWAGLGFDEYWKHKSVP